MRRSGPAVIPGSIGMVVQLSGEGTFDGSGHARVRAAWGSIGRGTIAEENTDDIGVEGPSGM
jgi:hypothetical protein